MKDKGLYICPNNHMYNANKYGNTCPNCGAKQEDKIKTIEEYEEELSLPWNEWATGLLICIKGINKGRVYTLHDGKNFIGSSPNMDVYIKGDLNIIPKNHTVIIYDSLERKTILLGSISQGMVHIKKDGVSKAVYDNPELESYTLLEIGESEFYFLQFCGYAFNWTE